MRSLLRATPKPAREQLPRYVSCPNSVSPLPRVLPFLPSSHSCPSTIYLRHAPVAHKSMCINAAFAPTLTHTPTTKMRSVCNVSPRGILHPASHPHPNPTHSPVAPPVPAAPSRPPLQWVQARPGSRPRGNPPLPPIVGARPPPRSE
jgi:hypothetical protein